MPQLSHCVLPTAMSVSPIVLNVHPDGPHLRPSDTRCNHRGLLSRAVPPRPGLAGAHTRFVTHDLARSHTPPLPPRRSPPAARRRKYPPGALWHPAATFERYRRPPPRPVGVTGATAPTGGSRRAIHPHPRPGGDEALVGMLDARSLSRITKYQYWVVL